jgi:hypothetical protein
MLSAAANVSVADVPAAMKSGPQPVPWPVVQVLSASASAASLLVSTLRLVARLAPEPVEGLASRAASRKALVRPSVLVLVAPMLVVLLANGASAQAAAAVVSSLIVSKEVLVRFVQGPIAVTIVSAGLLVVEVVLVVPPEATR